MVVLPDSPTDPNTSGPPPADSSSDSPSPAPEARSLEKRAGINYPINECPQQAQTEGNFGPRAGNDETFFHGSRCERDISLKAWSISCGTHADGISIRYAGKCADNEICIDGIEGAGQEPFAKCATHDTFLPIVNTLKSGGQQKKVTLTVSGQKSNDGICEVALAGKSGTDHAFKANWLAIEARDKNDKPLGCNSCYNSCYGCASIGIQPFPPGLDHFSTTVGLPNPGDEAQFYSFSLPRTP
ncbi:MAG: hypothetical protein Q9203_003335 [Teloschistes exilis]